MFYMQTLIFISSFQRGVSGQPHVASADGWVPFSRVAVWGKWPRSTSQMVTVMQLGSVLCTASYTPCGPFRRA